MNPGIGDKCSVPILGSLARHYGVCIGHDHRGPRFVHNSAEAGRVTVASFDVFTGGQPLRIDERAPAGSGPRVADAALSWVGQRYDVFRFNCEHFANLVTEGRAHSPQVLRGLFAGGVMALVGVVAWANRRNGGA